MLSNWEESQIHRGIDEIMFNLRHIDAQDVAYFLVKFNPNLAEELATAIEQNIFDKTEGKRHD
jgi:uncharacterized protein YecA (UPF0149 family)